MNRYLSYLTMLVSDLKECGMRKYISVNFIRKNKNYVSHQSRILNKHTNAVYVDKSALIDLEGTLTINEEYPRGLEKLADFIAEKELREIWSAM